MRQQKRCRAHCAGGCQRAPLQLCYASRGRQEAGAIGRCKSCKHGLRCRAPWCKARQHNTAVRLGAKHGNTILQCALVQSTATQYCSVPWCKARQHNTAVRLGAKHGNTILQCALVQSTATQYCSAPWCKARQHNTAVCLGAKHGNTILQCALVQSTATQYCSV